MAGTVTVAEETRSCKDDGGDGDVTIFDEITAPTCLRRSRGDARNVAASHKVSVEGPAVYVDEHARMRIKPGQYLKTVLLRVEGHSSPIAIPVHDGEVADLIAASFFRQYNLPFDESYIPVHNTIAAVLKREQGPEDISKSRVDPKIAAQVAAHPFLESSDKNKNVFLVVEIHFERGGGAGGKTLLFEVMEGEEPLDAVARHKDAQDLSEVEREFAVKHVTDRIIDKLLLEEKKVAEMQRGDRIAAMFGVEATSSQTLQSPLRHDSDPSWRRTDPDDLRDQDRVQEMLFHLQHPPSCSDRNLVVFSMDRAIWGLAVNIHFLTLLLNFCWRHNRTLVTADPDHWNYAGRECTRGWECFFHPISSCREDDVWQPYTSDIRNDILFDFRGYLYQVDTSTQRVLHFSNVDGPWLQLLSQEEYRLFLPETFRHRGHLWWRSQLTKFVMREKPFVRRYVEERRTAIGWHRDLVALHVRHGDKSWDVAHQASYMGGLQPYLDKAARLAGGQRGQLRYFISTDDPGVLEEAQVTGSVSRCSVG
ncbi:hypothetical protein GUITHDRAFT_148912 [Guillardia theta CCMP2712]|uniref:Alpha-(1,6)-fucosyltransferase N- and catalytic domain-containing protein n=1 Tax=Guillardia theta (strain CCMP2712) TaxID=905079 RepID=L1I7Z0_GUITC|nr:hypothetical protein GUITHDRAFT_148912 [Guillardia theta CCMP2712]EKX32019.1 hypothetical protein GUITHDRAFT_148912 [Guillardia theta CCMP2712]|eukprot:XP_005818999.1 hypothetical protein GUITHDRAFT_148912 [Guillardia theta CCMP2712]